MDREARLTSVFERWYGLRWCGNAAVRCRKQEQEAMNVVDDTKRSLWVASWAAIVSLSILSFGVVPAAAAPLSPEFRCRDNIAKATRKAASTIVNARAKCLKQRLRFKLGASVDCMADPAALGGPGSGDPVTDVQVAKILKRRDSAEKKFVSACKDLDLAATGIDDVCAVPATTTDELAQCAVMDIGKVAGDALTEKINIPQPAVAPPGGARKCYEVINRAIRFK
jgi:hypothetical protein